MTRKRFLMLERKDALQTVIDRTKSNLRTIHRSIQLCADRGWNYRIGSDIIPLATLPEFMADDGVQKVLADPAVSRWCDDILKLILLTDVRCSMHPDQFVVPASANKDTVIKAIHDLEFHALMMDRFGLPKSHYSPINIHMNCFKGNTREISFRFLKQFEKLSPNIQSRLVLENEDKLNSWSVNSLIKHFGGMEIPITYDNLHHKCNPDGLDAHTAMTKCMDTWPTNTHPLFHFSDSIPAYKNLRAHADYVSNIPSEYRALGKLVDLDFEFKMKDLAIERFQKEIDIV
jgi:UV DNA damage endonuclease